MNTILTEYSNRNYLKIYACQHNLLVSLQYDHLHRKPKKFIKKPFRTNSCVCQSCRSQGEYGNIYHFYTLTKDWKLK